MDWLLGPIDPTRAHDIGFAVSWHGRTMVLAWGILAPVAVLIARFFKVLPGQDWPRELDNQLWWRTHWMGQSCVAVLTIFGFALVLSQRDWSHPLGLHAWLGYAVLAGLLVQVLLGVFRGTKGGPTAPARDGSLDGDHYNMTPYRRAFEYAHKMLGYGILGLAMLTILFGMWQANAPVWMWGLFTIWWIALAACFATLQRRGFAVDTYQSIWGNDPDLPGNKLAHPGWGVNRPGTRRTTKKGQDDVRHHRGDRVRDH